MLASALDHYARQQRITAKALIAARRARWGTLARLTAIVTTFQIVAAKDAAQSSPLMLAEQGIDTDMAGAVVPSALAGVASDGRLLESLLDLTRLPDATEVMFDRIITTQIQDAARGAGSVAVAATPAVTGYVRMLNPPSCSRCAVLAGREYKWNTGFDRHPGCDCRHVPVDEDTADDLRTDPVAYFRSLPTAEQLREQYPDLTVAMRRDAGLFSQEDVFTKAGAQAIRDGGNIGQVVNARRGMSKAASGRLERRNVFGQDIATTTEGMTRRGSARRSRGKAAVRLMPESIYDIADGDRAEALRLLKVHGYIT